MELAAGAVGDRPWGVTLASLAVRGVTGELVVADETKRCAIALLDGVVVAASSSFAADSITRVALTNHLVSSTQVGEITKQLAAFPDRDELDVLATVTQLSPERAQWLRIRLIAQRAARTFSIDGAAFVLDDQVTLHAMRGSEVDMRAVVYQGARLYLSDQRIADDLRQLGSHFPLDAQAFDELHRFGFTDAELPIIHAIRAGATLPELEAVFRELDPRTTQSLVYALASCKAATAVHLSRPPRPPAEVARPESSPGIARTPTPGDGVYVARVSTKTGVSRTLTPREPIAPRTITPREPSVSRTETKPFIGRASAHRSIEDGRSDPPVTGRVPTRQPIVDDRVDPPATGRVHTAREPIQDRVDMSAIVRAPVPARTATSRGVGQRGHHAHEPAPARVPTRPGVTRASSEHDITQPRTATSQRDRERAEQAFKRGETLVGTENFDSAIVELRRACELSPGNLDYGALLAWVQFYLVTDKEAVAVDTRHALEKAIHAGDRPVVACFYLGRVERMLGREAEALRRFREVLEQEPARADAASEVRVLEARIAANAKR